MNAVTSSGVERTWSKQWIWTMRSFEDIPTLLESFICLNVLGNHCPIDQRFRKQTLILTDIARYQQLISVEINLIYSLRDSVHGLYKSSKQDEKPLATIQTTWLTRNTIMSGLGRLTYNDAARIGIVLEGFFYGEIFWLWLLLDLIPLFLSRIVFCCVCCLRAIPCIQKTRYRQEKHLSLRYLYSVYAIHCYDCSGCSTPCDCKSNLHPSQRFLSLHYYLGRTI